MTFEPARFLEVATKRGLELGRPLTFQAVTQSTNDDALAGAREGAPHGALYVAELQTKGRGRRGNRWHGTAGQCLTFTLLLRPSLPLERVSGLALVAGLAVRAAAEGWLAASGRAQGDRVLVKWPNDVLIRGRKLCGILAESQARGSELLAVALGVGLNVGPVDHIAELAETATSLADFGLKTPAFEEILADVLAALEPRLASFVSDPDAAFAELKNHDALFGRRVRIVARQDAMEDAAVGPGPHRPQDKPPHRPQDKPPHRPQDKPPHRPNNNGTAAGISRSGSLLVKDDRGTLREVVSGHVELLDD